MAANWILTACVVVAGASLAPLALLVVELAFVDGGLRWLPMTLAAALALGLVGFRASTR